MKDDNCLFCKIAAGEIPSDCLYNENGVYAFRDINPQAPVHFLVIPTEHLSGLSAVDASNSACAAQCIEVAAKLAAADERLAGGWRLVSNCGDDAGQSVHHLHFHVLGGGKLNDRMA